jgi:hypothetical protein
VDAHVPGRRAHATRARRGGWHLQARVPIKGLIHLLILGLQHHDHDNLKVRRWHYDDVMMMNASDTHHDTINIMIMIIFVVVVMTS